MLASRMDAVPPVPSLPVVGSNFKIAAPVPFSGKFVHRPPPIKIPEPAPSFGFKSRFGKVPETKATDDAAKLKAKERKKTKGEAEAEEAQSRLAQVSASVAFACSRSRELMVRCYGESRTRRRSLRSSRRKRRRCASPRLKRTRWPRPARRRA